MIHDQDEFAKKITGYLDAGAAELKAGTAYKLQQARAQGARAAGAQPARASETPPRARAAPARRGAGPAAADCAGAPGCGSACC